MIEVSFADKNKRVIRKEMYNSESKVKTLFEMLEGNEKMRELLPSDCNYVFVDTKTYWIDKRKGIWSIREMVVK